LSPTEPRQTDLPASRGGWIPGFDGLRGVAVLLVFGYHVREASGTTWPWPLSIVGDFGWMGVDLFFVLSGFLITGILLRTRGRPGAWRAFVIRRALRILPLYAVFCLGAFAIGGIATPWWTFPVFLQNWWLPYGAGQFVIVTWSLAIEEQFYIVWPGVVAALSRRALGVVLGALVVLAAGIRVGVIETYGPMAAYMWTICRMDTIAMGALAYLLWEQAPERVGAAARWAVGPLAGLAVLCSLAGSDVPALPKSLGYSLLGLLFTSVLLVVRSGHPARGLAWLDGALISLTGRWSYGFYLLHAPVLLWTWGLVRPMAPYPLDVVLLGIVGLWLSYALSWVSWHLVERGPLSLKDRLAATPEPVRSSTR